MFGLYVISFILPWLLHNPKIDSSDSEKEDMQEYLLVHQEQGEGFKSPHICEKLDREIHDKQEKANRENGSAILSGLANLAGKGKYAQLEAENEEMKKQVAAIPQVVAQQVETLTITYKEEITKERNRADFWLETSAKPTTLSIFTHIYS